MADDTPTSMAAAIDAVTSESAADSSSASPDTTSTGSVSSPATTAPAIPEPAASAPVSTPGPIPFDRHEAVLRKARDEFEAYRSRMRWAEQGAPEQWQQVAQWAQRFGTDPAGFLSEAQAELLAHPEHGQKLRSWAAKLLGQRGPSVTEEPGPDLVDPATGTKLYSADAQAKREAWLRQQMTQDVSSLLSPIQQREQQRAEREAQIVRQQQVTEWSQSTFDEAKAWPHFAELRQHIYERLKGDPLPPNAEPGEVGRRLATAYITEFNARVLPTLNASAQKTVLANLQSKAAASTLNPSTPLAGTPAKRPRSMREALAQLSA